MKNNMMELNLNEMEMVNSGLNFFGSLAKVTVGMINAVKNVGPTLCKMTKSLFCEND